MLVWLAFLHAAEHNGGTRGSVASVVVHRAVCQRARMRAEFGQPISFGKNESTTTPIAGNCCYRKNCRH